MKWLISVIAISFIMVGLSAQESTNTSGGEATSNEGSVCYSVGQIGTSTHSGTSGSFSEGVQQPYVIEVVIGDDKPGIDLKMEVYPNPTTDFLILSVGNELLIEGGWHYFLYDITEKEIKTQVITSDKVLINFSALQPSTYLLRVFKNKQETKTFKIIKE